MHVNSSAVSSGQRKVKSVRGIEHFSSLSDTANVMFCRLSAKSFESM